MGIDSIFEVDKKRKSFLDDFEIELLDICNALDEFGYHVLPDADCVLNFFEMNPAIDKSQFVFPGGNFDTFRKNTLNGLYKVKDCMETREQYLKHIHDLKSGKIIELHR